MAAAMGVAGSAARRKRLVRNGILEPGFLGILGKRPRTLNKTDFPARDRDIRFQVGRYGCESLKWGMLHWNYWGIRRQKHNGGLAMPFMVGQTRSSRLCSAMRNFSFLLGCIDGNGLILNV